MPKRLPPHRPLWCLVTAGARDGTGGDADRMDLGRLGVLARAGLDLVQIREPQREGRAACAFARACVSAVAGTSTLVLVNDRIDVALATGADGVHLRGDGPPASRVRGLVPVHWIVGRSVHEVDEAERVRREGGVDYLVAGTVFPTPSKAARGRHLGLPGLEEIASRVDIPVLGIGGLALSDARAVVGTGAAGIAGIGLFRSADLDEIVGALRTARRG